MFAITLRHPWAWAIRRLGKDIENRKFTPRVLQVGEWFAIHGGAPPNSPSEANEVYRMAIALMSRFGGSILHTSDYGDVICSGIVALAQFGGVVTESESPWFEGPKGWVLSKVVSLDFPVKCQGSQGIWRVPVDVEEQLSCELFLG